MTLNILHYFFNINIICVVSYLYIINFLYCYRKSKNSRKDTGYSTASSHTSVRNNNPDYSHVRKSNLSNNQESVDPESRRMMKQKLRRTDQDTRGLRHLEDAFSEESDNVEDERRIPNNTRKPRRKSDKELTKTASDRSSD